MFKKQYVLLTTTQQRSPE